MYYFPKEIPTNKKQRSGRDDLMVNLMIMLIEPKKRVKK